MNANSLARSVDVAILGGGPAGCSTALALGQEGFTVALIDRSNYLNVRVGETLPPEVKASLQTLGLWEQFLRDSPCACAGIRFAWGRPDVLESSSIFNPYETGWHIDRTRFDAMLARMAEKAGVHVLTAAPRISWCEGAGNYWEVYGTTDNKRFVIHAKFLVDASGRASALARSCSVRRILFDRLVGIVVFLPTTIRDTLGNCTFVEAVEDGWWYSAPLPNSRTVVAYMTDADLHEKVANHSSQYWREQLCRTTHSKTLISSRTPIAGPFVVAANSSRLSRFAGKNWLAVGDAAVAFDPLSGQGVYRALECGVRAALTIQRLLLGDSTALQSYANETMESFDRYLSMRDRFYDHEKRWQQSPFWHRRSSLCEVRLNEAGHGRWATRMDPRSIRFRGPEMFYVV
jgi:flavin-dependent dehydrogenase